MENLCNSILEFLLGGELDNDVADVTEVISLLNGSNGTKWKELYELTYQMRNDPTFSNFELQLRILNRIAESETAWITKLLYGVARNLVDKCLKEPNDTNLSQCARTIHRSFNLCLNDRNPNQSDNRRIGCYSLAPLECMIYHRLQNRDMIKNLIRVLESRSNELNREAPPHAVAYHYYIGEQYAYEGKHQLSCNHLQSALANCSYHSVQLWYILLLLIPQKMLCERKYCNVKTLRKICNNETFTRLMHYYQVPLKCFINGDLRTYDQHLNNCETFFLKHNLYICMLLLRELVTLKYCKLCWLYGSRKTITRFEIFMHHMVFTCVDDDNSYHQRRNQFECIIANLIAKGYIKGYISHSNECIVFSKKDPFPRKVFDKNFSESFS